MTKRSCRRLQSSRTELAASRMGLDLHRQIVVGAQERAVAQIRRAPRRAGTAAGALALLLAAGSAAAGSADAPARRSRWVPVPRFVSLKSDRVNLRQGPGTEYPTAWVFRRAGLPVEVIKEFESWRQVRDAEGTTGWVLGSMLSGRRTAVILPWEARPGRQQVVAVLRDDDSERPSRCPGRSRGPRQHHHLRREVVSRVRRGFSRLHRAGEAVGRLQGRGDQVGDGVRPRAARSRTLAFAR